MSAPTEVPRLLGVCAYASGAGKTTLLTQLIPLLVAEGLRVSVIKHAHHRFDIDHPGKDSYRLREAGAVQTLIGSRHRWALMTELSRIPSLEAEEPSLQVLVSQLDARYTDLVLVEGFRHEALAKIEIHRPALNMPLLSAQDPDIIAIASDGPVDSSLPVLDLNKPVTVARFILNWMNAAHGLTPQT
ncbi:molybdopterin-guanine dinucleotide biosynthesis protein B [Methylobacillus flagellatus]|uniref:molybdopterin-guanine dinucleotide biosynthesis protein B n=1 Tax=Methylobacillus flagellatus TaxID=405 RepID=UPI0010F6251D|nr:molybdopterin-guanine dinucleotide biosynthesis protein B [Methylobacillus flagellatus]